MKNRKKHISEQIFLSLLFVIVGSTIMIIFSPWRPLLDRTPDYLGRVGLITALVVISFLLRRNGVAKQYLTVLYGLIILITTVSLDWIIGIYFIFSFR